MAMAAAGQSTTCTSTGHRDEKTSVVLRLLLSLCEWWRCAAVCSLKLGKICTHTYCMTWLPKFISPARMCVPQFGMDATLRQWMRRTIILLLLLLPHSLNGCCCRSALLPCCKAGDSAAACGPAASLHCASSCSSGAETAQGLIEHSFTLAEPHAPRGRHQPRIDCMPPLIPVAEQGRQLRSAARHGGGWRCAEHSKVLCKLPRIPPAFTACNNIQKDDHAKDARNKRKGCDILPRISHNHDHQNQQAEDCDASKSDLEALLLIRPPTQQARGS